MMNDTMNVYDDSKLLPATRMRGESNLSWMGKIADDEAKEDNDEYFRSRVNSEVTETLGASIMNSAQKKVVLLFSMGVFYSIYLLFLKLEPDPSMDTPTSLIPSEFCQIISTKSMLLSSFVLIWIQYLVSDKIILPFVYRNHLNLSLSKRRKTLCYFVKSVSRAAILTNCFIMWNFVSSETIHFSCQDKECVENTRAFGQLVTLALAMVVWELSYMPELSWDMWAHHLIICFVIILATEPSLDIYKDPYYPKFVFILAFGAAWAVISEFGMLIYHETPKSNVRQQFLIIAVILVVKMIMFVAFFGIWAISFVAKHFHDMNHQARTIAVIVCIGNLLVEGYMLRTAFNICMHKWRKYRAQDQKRLLQCQ